MIEVYDDLRGDARYSSAGELASICPESFTAHDRVVGVNGKAIDWNTWYTTWISRQGGPSDRMPTHLQVMASDEFQATIPWPELAHAFLLVEQENGEPLKKGFPIRLYVPDGSSECLNVKSVVKIRILYEEKSEIEATYGFKNTVTAEQLRKPNPQN
ncbi:MULTISPECIES: molybdopterin-dependent oxidoreductase [unclassified Paenibacillus]|uniref:molybdopterin-dependent oxidoreductase n=1 Tax=unclassified Paenibacillus TaxID=185978 RepID=UPI001AE152CD|nr:MULTISPECIES: molybdopterin-dependent oxidoreductase [unclassified Paenibacillus]MBP1154565.1 hypothetical protein [Paenibacillus sp. PvP091]MBP1170051.1 hypothetical protein [Paenibacillus sp. PvR098]MBP2441079.1 hypothetical protein [Paenibacillus sp. PvP052]